MLPYDISQLFIFACLLLLLTPLLGSYFAAVFNDKPIKRHYILGWLEQLTYRIGGINPNVEMNWKAYLKALLSFNAFIFFFLFVLLLLQGNLLLNPQHYNNIPWPLAFNIAASFVTNTNWQSYPPETTTSYLSTTLGLTMSNFLSTGTSIATLVALVRGFTRVKKETIGNFWTDLIRSIIYILLPLSLLLSLSLVSQGVVQNFSSNITAKTLEKREQVLPLGPAASQIAIKQLGSSGGGYYNVNSAHPYENPTPLSNLLENIAILILPAAQIYAFGKLSRSKKHGWLLLSIVFFVWLVMCALGMYFQQLPNNSIGINPVLEGQEIRFGTFNSIIWTLSTTGTGNGSVNTMFSSLSPLAGGLALVNILLGQVIFGSTGTGLCTLLMYILLTVFLSGLMVGRTPEYLGKKIEKKEMQWVMLALLLPQALILIGTGISCILPIALADLDNKGPHGFTEILFTFASTTLNNGSSFAGLNANTNYYNIILAVCMLLGRTAVIVPSIAIAGLLVKKKTAPQSLGTFSTNTLLFALLLITIIFLMGALSYFPALSLGPVVEHLLMTQGKLF